MNKKDYLNRLLGLQAFIKENPEYRKVYSDLHIQEQIALTRHEVILEEEEKKLVSVMDSDGFCSCTSSPFDR